MTLELPCSVSGDCDAKKCPSLCPDEQAKQNIASCYTALFGMDIANPVTLPEGFECPSDCDICEFGFRRREP